MGSPERSAPLDVRLDGQLVWVLPDPRDHGTAWIVAYADGSLDRVTVDTAGPASIEPDFAPPLALGAPPMVTRSAQDTRAISVRSAFDDLEGVVDALPGSRLVTAPDGTTVALTDPTDRYQHGVVGDVLEAASFEIQAADGYRNRTIVDDHVIEGLSALLADLDDDGSDPEIVFTLSDAAGFREIARLPLDGTLASDVAATADEQGRHVLAAATDDGRLRIFR